MAKKLSPSAAMLNLTIGYWVSRLVAVAAELRLADLLKRGPRTVEDLAAAAGVQPQPLYRVLRALASVGVFAETKGRKFKLTPLAATLQTGVPGSMRAFAIMISRKFAMDPWQELMHGLQTGEVPFIKSHGVHPFEYLEKHPDELQIFGESMTDLSKIENPAIVGGYKFSKLGTLVDVGGGFGNLLAAILKANRKLKGVLYDQSSVVARARTDQHLTEKGIAERVSFESGSFFESAPRGGDAYIMKYILHDWNDEACVTILRNCRAAMNPKGRVLVVDAVIPPGNDPGWGKLLDINMLTIGGRERTKAEFAALFAKAGLRLAKVHPTKSPLSIVEGVAA